MARIAYSQGDKSSFKVLPNGTYEFRITDVEQGVSSNGNPQIKVKFEVVDGPYRGDTVTAWYSLVPKALWKVLQLVEALGIETEGTGEVDDKGEEIMAFDTDDLIGCLVSFDVGQREYNGRKSNEFNDPKAVEAEDEEEEEGEEDEDAEEEEDSEEEEDRKSTRLNSSH